ncbi:asparaginase domain-containing protein [Pochonia chlamydosporia 170]|uniref:asparaginase n=1 Tax=Pochonia chlamydosporia 170 TaxID=1380566 RepID=A0A179F198_METCM|nr:asparaginase domain-containing protein [Pochonia chlamydosporia 170]OAQ59030.1 asparaginase domain-containing protein [Pochonia chlamydosporia 170]
MGRQRKLREIVIIDTGGTITAISSDPAATAGYECGELSVKDMLKEHPRLTEKAQIKVINLKRKGREGSPDTTSSDRLNLTVEVQRQLNAGADAVIMLHGTDTLLMTAFSLSITIQPTRTIILTGATLPSNCHGADGDKNMLCALVLGLLGLAGVHIVFDFEILQPLYTRKLTTASSRPFYSFTGPIATFKNSVPRFFNEPTRPVDLWYFDVTSLGALPDVVILPYQDDMDEGRFLSATANAKGVVLGGVGDGSWPKSLKKLIQARSNNIPVVISSDSFGFIVAEYCYGLGPFCIGSGYLDPSQSRLLLQYCLAAGYTTPAAIKDLFERQTPTDLDALLAKL